MQTQRTVLTLFGTRPEIIKLAPVIRALETSNDAFRNVNVSSSQHTDLLHPFARGFGVQIDHDLAVMAPGQRPADVLARVVAGVGAVIDAERPDLLLVQGDTTTALAGALAACYARVPVGHVEAGLRTGDPASPIPEEITRRLIGRVADGHFAAPAETAATLRAEGVDDARIVVTGNPVVDALHGILADGRPSAELADLLARVAGRRLLVVTTHRRENFGDVMAGHLRALRRFVGRHDDLAVVFPVHPNPAVRAAAEAELAGVGRIHRIAPLAYADFIHLLSQAWLIASDSGGIQEEAPTLGKPVLILRDTTERPEAIACGVGRLVGHDADRFEAMLEAAYRDTTWFEQARSVVNPFGRGDAGARIVAALRKHFTMAGSA
ncbi:MAG: non-hydrolyzing UDP-N-acetylglucosamine 2-epimerase [Lautropia sp.]